jgi:YVTN family beta-propeller protein
MQFSKKLFVCPDTPGITIDYSRFKHLPKAKSRRNVGALLVLLASAAIAAAQPIAYVANSGSNTVATINVGTASMTGSVTVPTGPSGIAVTPDGSTIYVSSLNNGEVTALNAATHAVIATVKVGTSPTHVAINPAGTLVYVVDQGSNQISAINHSTKTLAATIPVGNHPTAVAFSPDGSRAYVTNAWANTISVINPSLNEVIATFGTATAPMDVAVSPDSQTLYVACVGNSAVGVYSNAGSLITTMTGFSYPVAIALTPGGTRAFVVNENSSSVSVVDLGSHSVIANTTVGSLPVSVAMSADGSEAFITNQFGLSLSVLSTSTGGLVKTIPSVGVYPVSVATIPPTAKPITCSYSLTSGGASLGSGGGSGTASISAPSSCGWQAFSDSSWLTIQSGFSGSGTGTVSFSVAANTGTSTRTGHLIIGGDSFTVTEAGMGFQPIRVNCGGPAITDALGSWSGDNLANHSETAAAIGNTSVPELYTKERWSTGTLQYTFSVPNGSRTVKLHFAEIYLTTRGQRVFNILINGVTVQSNFDILAVTSPNTAYDLSFPVSVTTGQLSVALVPVMGSPKLSALEVF